MVTGLWDSWADDAFIRDVQSGDFFDPEKLHVLGHQGELFSVRGPLNIGRPVQGWPVIVQAGASNDGVQLAAQTAEIVFAAAPRREDGIKNRAELHQRMNSYGRDPNSLKYMPAALVVVAHSVGRGARTPSPPR